MPQIKVSKDIIDLLEGLNSSYYADFKAKVIQLYNILRSNRTILYLYFKLISEESNLNWSLIESKLDLRTMMGVSYKDIEISLINEIESANSLYNMFGDICHMYMRST